MPGHSLPSVGEKDAVSNPLSGVIYKGEKCKARLLQWSKATNPDRVIRKVREKLAQ